jgi:hypothetical protein
MKILVDREDLQIIYDTLRKLDNAKLGAGLSQQIVMIENRLNCLLDSSRTLALKKKESYDFNDWCNDNADVLAMVPTTTFSGIVENNNIKQASPEILVEFIDDIADIMAAYLWNRKGDKEAHDSARYLDKLMEKIKEFRE